MLNYFHDVLNEDTRDYILEIVSKNHAKQIYTPWVLEDDGGLSKSNNKRKWFIRPSTDHIDNTRENYYDTLGWLTLNYRIHPHGHPIGCSIWSIKRIEYKLDKKFRKIVSKM